MEYSAAPLRLDITKNLCTFLSSVTYEDLPEAAVHAARRGVLDWLGCALAACRDPKIEVTLSVLKAAGTSRQASVIGRDLKLGLLEAPLVNGQMGHLLDFDDTHMGGVVLHTSSPVLPALLALSEMRTVSGRELIAAYAVGFEAGVRVGKASPAHHEGGWHLTGTLGTIAAGAAAARLLRLDAQGMTHALGLAATQAAGMQQNRGTMAKSFHAGRAASNGLLAALLAERGFDSSEEIIEGRRGFCRIYSAIARPELALEGLGNRWEIARNGHKPYACGVVLHPTIDAVIALREKSGLAAAQVERIELRVHPLAVRITGIAEPQSGLQAKFSLAHSAAVAFLDRSAGIAQYSDERARAREVVALRGKISAAADDSLRKDEAHGCLVATSGERFQWHVEHASGTVENPMSDAAIGAKFLANAVPVLGEERARRLAQEVWRLDELADVAPLIALAAYPSSGS
ncbi:MAG TPA: MmgE/PrpD family protein [Hyphomicrobiaceae bacterium]|nr:MmgE/PrpD family protein [Hyphomicrobiaceae bacterium]